MPGRLPDVNVADPEAALDAFLAERQVLAIAAKAGLDFTGAVRPPRAAEERAWLIRQAEAGGPSADREDDATLNAPQGPRKRLW